MLTAPRLSVLLFVAVLALGGAAPTADAQTALDQLEAAQPPQIEADAAGNFTILSFRAPERPYVIDRSASGAFSEPRELLPPDQQSTFSRILAVGPSGDAAVLLAPEPLPRAGSEPDPQRLALTASVRRSGEPFGAPERLPLPPIGSSSPQIAVDGQGDTIVVFVTNRFELLSTIRPAGGTFERPQVIARDAVEVDLQANAAGDALVAYTTTSRSSRVKVARRSAGGSFGPAFAIGRGDDRVSLGLSPGGRAVVAWTRGGGRSGFEVLAATGSVDQQVRFGAAQKLSRTNGGSARALVDPSGTATVVFSRGRSDDAPLGLSSTAPGGTRFGSVRTLSLKKALLDDLAVDARGVVSVIWIRNVRGGAVQEYRRGNPLEGFSPTRRLAGPFGFRSLATGPSGEALTVTSVGRRDRLLVVPLDP